MTLEFKRRFDVDGQVEDDYPYEIIVDSTTHVEMTMTEALDLQKQIDEVLG